jgi:hypothetical protein
VPNRPLWPLALVSLLAVGDYLLWNWSLSGNHDTLALVAGLSLPPLLVAFAWLLVASAGRALAHTLRRPRVRSGAQAGHDHRSTAGARTSGTATGEPHTVRAGRGAGAAGETSSSSKLAA